MFDNPSLVDYLNSIVLQMQHAENQAQAIDIATAILSESCNFPFPVLLASHKPSGYSDLSIYWLIDDQIPESVRVALVSKAQGEMVQKTIPFDNG